MTNIWEVFCSTDISCLANSAENSYRKILVLLRTVGTLLKYTQVITSFPIDETHTLAAWWSEVDRLVGLRQSQKREIAIVNQPNQTKWKVISTYSPWDFSAKGVITRLQSHVPEPKWRSCKVPVRTRLKTKTSDLILPYHIEGNFSLLKLLYDINCCESRPLPSTKAYVKKCCCDCRLSQC